MARRGAVWYTDKKHTLSHSNGASSSLLSVSQTIQKSGAGGSTFSGCLGYPCYSALRHNMCCFGGTGSARLNQSLFPRFVFFSLSFLFFTLFLIWRIVFCINRCLLLFYFSNRSNVLVLIFAFPPLTVRRFGFSLPSFHAVGQVLT